MIIASKKETFRILNEYNLIAKKGYGQNFLINHETIKRIVDGCQIREKTLVIEIGPGLGALTQELLNVSKQVIAIEIDKKMIDVLNANFNTYNNLLIINNDFMKVNLWEIIDKYPEYEEVVVVSNLPYYITSDILEKIISLKHPKIKRIVAMMQKEVGKKLLKKETKIESYLKVLVDNYCDVNTVMYVSKNDFEPRPKVDSIVLDFCLNKDKYQLDYYFFEIIKECLKNRRKTLINTMPIDDKSKISDILSALGLKETVRIEELSISQMIAVVEEMKK
jgi:16S rRNA (adenine1518-N6/adenine1519-N6)-dimethyltransferase